MILPKLLTPLCIVTAAIAASAVLLSGRPAVRAMDVEPAPPAVRVVVASPGPLQLSIRSQGSIAPRTEADTGWHAIPMQVDERAVVDLGVVYDSSPVGLAPLVYTDAGTLDRAGIRGNEREHGRKMVTRIAGVRRRKGPGSTRRDSSPGRLVVESGCPSPEGRW